MERINQYAANFLFHIKEIPEKPETPRRENSAKHIPSVDWSHKITPDPITTKELHHDNSVAKIYKIINDKRLGFPDHIYPQFIKFTTYLSSLPLFSNLASQEFILDQTFDWLIESYQANRINHELIPYLQNHIDEKTETRTFHFPVLNLIIEEPFQIGNSTFQYFTKEYFDEYWNESIGERENKEDFDNVFSKYCGKVFITCTAKAEPNKAEDLAFEEACLAMDVLRLFSPAVIIPTKIFKVDLERRININYSSDHLSETTNGERNILLSMKANNEPFHYVKEMHKLSMENGLSELSTFIKTKRTDDLYKLILHSISFYSFALSNPDLHLRISHLIMIAEGLLLEEGYVNEMQKKTKLRFSKLFFPTSSKQFQMFNEVLASMYSVRHAITHKGNRKLIDSMKFTIFQTKLAELLIKLIELNKTIKTKADLITHIDLIPNS